MSNLNDIDISPSTGFSQIYNNINSMFIGRINPLLMFILVGIVIFYLVIFSYLGVSYKNISVIQGGVEKTTSIRILEIFMWGLFIFLVLINGLQYFFGLNIKTSIKNLLSGAPEVDLKFTPEKNIKMKKSNNNSSNTGIRNVEEVFHINNNKFTYNQAKAVCKAHNAKLASYSQIEDVYKQGAEWCGFGWSDGQMALYPTQKATWDKLQKKKGHEQSCGRPGINGGYIANANIKFGANCFGKKPNPNDQSLKNLNTDINLPMTKEEREMEQTVKYYKNHLDSIMVAPFNYEKWSKI